MQVWKHFEQRSVEWAAARSGRITMSAAKQLLTKGNGVTRRSYLLEVAAEILAGPPKDAFQGYDMLRGIELEPFAIRAYEELSGCPVEQVGFVVHDDDRIGCSPDGLMLDLGLALEIKCPQPKHHLRYMDRQQVEKDHGPQMQGEAWVCEVDRVDFVSFCPWVRDAPLVVHTFRRDNAIIKALADSALRGADEVEQMVEAARACGIAGGIEAIAKEAALYWDAFSEAQRAEVILDE